MGDEAGAPRRPGTRPRRLVRLVLGPGRRLHPRLRTHVRLTSRSVQRSFDDLGTPLHDVTFCVVDLETTGGSPIDNAVTELAAVKLQGGRCTGTFATLVNPGAL